MNHGAYSTYRSYALVFISLISAILISALAMVAEIKPEQSNNDSKAPGTFNVYAMWEPGDTDIDLWVKSPDDDSPVGFLHTHGTNFDLLRDDQGEGTDDASNFENAYSRLLPAGEYIVNIHCFDCVVKLPIKVTVEVTIAAGSQMPLLVYKETLTLTKLKQEMTVIRLTLDDKGKIVGQSRICHPLKETACI